MTVLYALTRDTVLALMKAPTEPPDAPVGHRKSDVFRASPRYLTYRLLVFWLVFLASWLIPLGLVVADFVVDGLVDGKSVLVWLGVALVPVLAIVGSCVYFAIRIDYDMRYYIVTDRSLRVREGAFTVREKTLSFANVQNIRVTQGPLLRLFGIWHLELDTAGGGASPEGQPAAGLHRVRVAGIENAREVRDQLQACLRLRGRSAGLGDLDDGDDGDEVALHGTGSSHSMCEALRELKSATAALRASLDRSSH